MVVNMVVHQLWLSSWAEWPILALSSSLSLLWPLVFLQFQELWITTYHTSWSLLCFYLLLSECWVELAWILQCRDWKWPKIASKDKALHLVFAVAFVLMVACAIATVLCFTTDREELIKYKVHQRPFYCIWYAETNSWMKLLKYLVFHRNRKVMSTSWRRKRW